MYMFYSLYFLKTSSICFHIYFDSCSICDILNIQNDTRDRNRMRFADWATDHFTKFWIIHLKSKHHLYHQLYTITFRFWTFYRYSHELQKPTKPISFSTLPTINNLILSISIHSIGFDHIIQAVRKQIKNLLGGGFIWI